MRGESALPLMLAMGLAVGACRRAEERTAKLPPPIQVPSAPKSPRDTIAQDTTLPPLDRTGLYSLIHTIPNYDEPITETSPNQAGWAIWMDGPTEYGVSVIRAKKGIYLTLDSLVGRDGGSARWMILDAIWRPEETDSLRFAYLCGNSPADANRAVMGMVVPQDSEWYRHVITAWRADSLTHRFVPISPVGLRCFNISYGAD